MNFKTLTDHEKQELAQILFTPLNSPEELRDWLKFFLDLEVPHYITDIETNSNPLDAIWQIYNTFRLNTGDENPGYILMSSRESMKTVGVAMVELLLLLHFELDIAHAAATETQSAVGLKYIEGFISQIEPLMTAAGWTSATQNKRMIQYNTPKGKTPFIKVLIASAKGFNSLHTNVIFVDELDLADPVALKEAKNIVGYSRGIYGITVYLSTRKYAFGPMNDAIEKADEMGWKILRWNLLDVTERCPATRHKPELPKQDMYVAKNLPLLSIDTEAYSRLADVEKVKYDLLPQVFNGCIGCKLLPVCRTNLAAKPDHAVGGFYKPINSIIQKFRENDPETAEAQLLCFGPETQILMGDGSSKDIKDVTVGDQVITHTGRVSMVTETFKRPYKGEAIKVNNHSWKHFPETIVTPEHPYFVNGAEFKSVSEIKVSSFSLKWFEMIRQGDYTSLPSAYEPTAPSEIQSADFISAEMTEKDGKIRLKGSTGKYIPKTFVLDSNFGWIVGYFLAEGFFAKDHRETKRNGCFRSGLTFCSDIRETEYHERVVKFAELCGLTVSHFKAKAGHGNTIDIYNKTLAEMFFGICGELSDGKRLHRSLINANLEFLAGVLRGFDAGDGTKRKNSYRELTTCSYTLASQLFLIAARLGLVPRVTRKPPPSKGKQAYLVHHVDPDYKSIQKRTRFKYENGYNQYRTDSLEKTEYDGYVYNIEVENDHSYIANGVSVHNCWKPGSQGLVYPRFKNSKDKGNLISLETAHQTLSEMHNRPLNIANETNFIQLLRETNTEIYAAADWGFTNESVLIIAAKLSNGQIWILDCFSSPGLEFSDILEVACTFRDNYRVLKWFCDPAMPSHLVSFTRNGMKAPKFQKDVVAGIEAVRSKIVNATGVRQFFVIDTPNNKKVINSLNKHRFILDGAGNPTMKPDDEPQIADIADALRYLGQNLFPVKGPQKIATAWMESEEHLQGMSPSERTVAAHNSARMRQAIAEATGGQGNGAPVSGTQGRGGFKFSF